MKTIQVTIQLFEKGDLVCTPSGYGKVIRSEIHNDNDGFYYNQEVLIELKTPLHGDKFKSMESCYLHLVSEEEYENGI